MGHRPSSLQAFVTRALAPHWGALLALALFLIAGLTVLDDYGVTWDEPLQRSHAERNLAHVLGKPDALPADHNKFYGVAFELPALLTERAFGLEDSRSVYLSRHLLIHLFFLTGGFFAYLLAQRLFGNRLLALAAMLLFLLHPRLYAHSFANSSDIPFVAMFVIALYLTHRAFKQDSLRAFVLLGLGIGALANLRIMGVLLFAAVPAMRALDFAYAQGWAERKRALLSTGAFALAGALTIYALMPYLWPDPIGRSVEWWTTLSSHPHNRWELFRGTLHLSAEFPNEYLPVWISITSPPFALLLGLIGAALILARGVKAPGAALRDKNPRFALALVGCFALPLLSVILLNANVYDEWRQMFFLWAPFSLLAAYGLWRITAALRRAWLRAAAYGAVAAGLAATALSMALLHPNQQDTFNFFVDRVTPERLRSQYVMGYWSHPVRQALEWAIDRRSDSPAAVNVRSHVWFRPDRTRLVMPREERENLSIEMDADALVLTHDPPRDEDGVLYVVKVYGNTALYVQRKADLQLAYASATAGEPVLRSLFDVYYADDALTYVKEPCGPSDVAGEFRLRIFPEDAADLPARSNPQGHEDMVFLFQGYGAFFDGKCVAVVPLPAYPVAAIRASQWLWPESLWESGATFALEYRAAHRAAVSGEPLARSVFDLFLVEGDLVYVREECDQADAAPRFFLHILPQRAADLPEERREYGFDNLDFDFFLNGALFDGKCVARAAMPEYPIARFRTGQYVRGQGELWGMEFVAGG